MANTRTVDLYLNLARPADAVLLAGRNDLTPAEPPIFIDGEKPTLRLQFIAPSLSAGVAPTVADLDVGDTVLVAIKKTAGGTLLVSGVDFAAQGAGSDLRYVAVVDFNTTPLIAALAEDPVVLAIAEVRVQNAAGNNSKLFQFRVVLRRRIYAGEETPISGGPTYPDVATLALRAPVAGTYRIKTTVDGQFLQLKHATSGKFHSLFVTGDEGAETLALAAGEV